MDFKNYIFPISVDGVDKTDFVDEIEINNFKDTINRFIVRFTQFIRYSNNEVKMSANGTQVVKGYSKLEESAFKILNEVLDTTQTFKLNQDSGAWDTIFVQIKLPYHFWKGLCCNVITIRFRKYMDCLDTDTYRYDGYDTFVTI